MLRVQQRKWTSASLNKAIHAVQSRRVSMRAAAKQFANNLPSQNVRKHQIYTSYIFALIHKIMYNKHNNTHVYLLLLCMTISEGKLRVLKKAHWLLSQQMQLWNGYRKWRGLGTDELGRNWNQQLKNNGERKPSNPFTNNIPGRKWVSACIINEQTARLSIPA